METTTKNGAATKAAAKTTKTAGTKTPASATSKAAQPEPAEKPAAKTEPTIEDRIRKVNQMAALCEQRGRLIEAMESIDKFNFASDAKNDSLIISDAQGNNFKTGNSEVIKMVADLITGQIEARLVEVERHIRI